MSFCVHAAKGTYSLLVYLMDTVCAAVQQNLHMYSVCNLVTLGTTCGVLIKGVSSHIGVRIREISPYLNIV